MVHLTFAFYLLALVAGSAALSQTLLAWQTHRKAVIRWYALFLLSLLLILLQFLLDLYARVASLAGSRAMASLLWIIQAAGGLTYICTAPFRLETPDCILCGSCVDACPSKALRYSFSSGK